MASSSKGIRVDDESASAVKATTVPASPSKSPVTRLPMVGWYDPRQLAKTAVEVTISTIFGRHSDFRIVEALASGESEIYDYTYQYEDDGAENCRLDMTRPRSSIWIDYVGDVGDGWNSTYAVAHHLAEPTLIFSFDGRETGQTCEETTKRGEVLIFGGDQVYPTASRDEYQRRLYVPYETALRETKGDYPHVFAIPGNHDWYDSLVSFTRLFTSRRWFGGWRTRQSRSYFALKLPHGWWFLGTDVQLGSDIDSQQVAYFEKVGRVIEEEQQRSGVNQHIILAHAEPHWIRAALYEEVDPNYNESNLLFLEKKLGQRVSVYLAGDLHHYRRHEATDGSKTQKITAGGGGAFLHPTHYGLFGKNLDEIEEKPSGRKFKLQAVFPPKDESRKMCWRNLIFPYLKENAFPQLKESASWTFGFVTAVLYLLMTLSVVGQIDDRYREFSGLGYQFGSVMAMALSGILNSTGTLLLAAVVLFGFIFFTDTHSRIYRAIMGTLHGLAHILTAFAIAMVSVVFISKISSPGWVLHIPFGGQVFNLDLRMIVASLLILLGGFVFGSLVMGIYLLISMNVFGRHSNEAFSSLSVEDWKHFLRLHIDEQGALCIYPIGIRKVPRKWKPNEKDAQPELLSDDTRATSPELIEDPIKLDWTTPVTSPPAGEVSG